MKYILLLLGSINLHVGEIIMNESRWLSVKEIAQYLGVKKDTIYKWVTAKKIPAHKVGRLWKFRKDEVDEWVRSGSADTRKLGKS